jgi:molecular chaperone DnaK
MKQLLFLMQGKRTTPSIIAFVEGEIKVEILQKTSGNNQLRLLLLSNVLWDKVLVKFRLSKKSFKVVKGTTIPRVDIDGRLYTAQELSACTLLQNENNRLFRSKQLLKQLLLFLLTLMMHNVKLLKLEIAGLKVMRISTSQLLLHLLTD